MWIECKKIWNKKSIKGLVIFLFIFEIGMFAYSIQQKQIQWETWNASTYEEEHARLEKEYISGFHDHITSIVTQSDVMGTISIFAQTDSFSNKNLTQTKEDFIDLLDISPMVIKSPFLIEFFSDSWIHFVVIVVGIGMAFVLIEEKKQGLRGMIYATINGRGTFVLYKGLALFVGTGIVTFLFYGGLLVTSSISFHGNLWSCWDYPVQSLSIFANVHWKISIGGFLAIYLLGRWMVAFYISFLVWTILFCIDNLLISIGAVGMIGLISYVVYSLIESSHALQILRFCNPWYWLCGNDFFTEYRNMNLFSQVVNKNVLIEIWMLITILGMLLLTVCIGIRRYPCDTSKGKMEHWMKVVIQKFKNWQSTWMRSFTLTGMEYYKILISQKGILIFLVIIVVFFYQTDITEIQFSGSQEMYFSFIERNGGVPDEAAKAELQELEMLLSEVEKVYLLSQESYEAGEISLDEAIRKSMWYQGYEQERLYLKQMKEQTNYLEQLKERDIEGWYVNIYSYNKLLSEGNVFVRILMYLGVILLSSGIITIEDKFGMHPLIRSSAFGQRSMLVKKIQVAVVLSLVLYMILTGIEFATVWYVYGLDLWEAPAQSIMSLSAFPIRCSIGTFLVMRFLGKGIVIALLAGTTCVVSSNYKKWMRKIRKT